MAGSLPAMVSSVHGGDSDRESESARHQAHPELCQFQDNPPARSEFREAENCDDFEIGGQVMTADGYFARIRAFRIAYGHTELHGCLDGVELPEHTPGLQNVLVDLEVTGLGMRYSVPGTEICAKSDFSGFRDCLSSDSTVIFSGSPAASQADFHFDKSINTSSGLTPAASYTWSPIFQQQECSLPPNCADLPGHRQDDSSVPESVPRSESPSASISEIPVLQYYAETGGEPPKSEIDLEPAREQETSRTAESESKAQRDVGIQSTPELLEDSFICVKAAELGAMLDRGADYSLMMRCFHLWQMMMFCRVQFEEGVRQLEETKLELDRQHAEDCRMLVRLLSKVVALDPSTGTASREPDSGPGLNHNLKPALASSGLARSSSGARASSLQSPLSSPLASPQKRTGALDSREDRDLDGTSSSSRRSG